MIVVVTEYDENGNIRRTSTEDFMEFLRRVDAILGSPLLVQTLGSEIFIHSSSAKGGDNAPFVLKVQ